MVVCPASFVVAPPLCFEIIEFRCVWLCDVGVRPSVSVCAVLEFVNASCVFSCSVCCVWVLVSLVVVGLGVSVSFLLVGTNFATRCSFCTQLRSFVRDAVKICARCSFCLLFAHERERFLDKPHFLPVCAHCATTLVGFQRVSSFFVISSFSCFCFIFFVICFVLFFFVYRDCFCCCCGFRFFSSFCVILCCGFVLR